MDFCAVILLQTQMGLSRVGIFVYCIPSEELIFPFAGTFYAGLQSNSRLYNLTEYAILISFDARMSQIIITFCTSISLS